jgi:NodT family efflux transporter outer membrane factor (OMF) lipoprotein
MWLTGGVVLSLVGCASSRWPAPIETTPNTLPATGVPADNRWAAAPVESRDEPTRPSDADRRWWAGLGDPALTEAVERALARNLDIALTRARLDEARAALRQAEGQRAVQVSVGGSLEARSRDSGSSAVRAVNPAVALQLEADADLWGRLSAVQRAAQAQAMGRFDEVQATRLSVAALTARSVLAWREAEADARTQARSVELLRDTARVVRVRVDAGLAPRLDGLRIESELAAAQSALLAAGTRTRDALRAVQRLTGDEHPGGPMAWQPAAEAAASAASSAAPRPLAQAVHLPADLLRQRPDLRAAEQAWRAAWAERDAAAAARLPSLRLPGVLSLSTAASGEWLARLALSLAAQWSQSITDGGQAEAAQDVAQARVQAAELLWRRSLQAALADAEAAFVAQAGAEAATQAQLDAVRAADAAVAQARTLYDNGLTGLLDLLDAQRSALLRQQVLLRQQTDALRARVAVFEAMGLVTAEDPAAAQAAMKAR